MLVFILFIVSPNIKINGTEVENFGLGALDALPIEFWFGLLVWRLVELLVMQLVLLET